MIRLLGRSSIATVLIAVLTLSVHGQKTLNISFDSTETITESCGLMHTAAASGLDATTRAAIVMKVQAKFDAALGAGQVTVAEGATGGTNRIIASGAAPPVAGEKGDAGKGGGAGIVHLPGFAPHTGTDLCEAIANAVAHEAGHQLGAEHKSPPPNTIMNDTYDRTVFITSLSFGAASITEMQKSLGIGDAKHKLGFLPTDMGVRVGMPLNSATFFDHCLDLQIIYSGLPGFEFGYMTGNGDFVFAGDSTNGFSNPSIMSPLYDAGVDLAVKHIVSGNVYALSGGFGNVSYSNPNPSGFGTFLNANVAIDVTNDLNPNIFLFVYAGVVPTSGGLGNPVVGLPGNGNDFTLSSAVGNNMLGTGPLMERHAVFAGDTLVLEINSPNGTFVFVPPYLGLDPYFTSFPHAPPQFPNVWLNINQTYFVLPLQTFLGQTLLPPQGFTLSFSVPTGLSGVTVRVQGALISSLAQNGVYASTDAHEFEIH